MKTFYRLLAGESGDLRQLIGNGKPGTGVRAQGYPRTEPSGCLRLDAHLLYQRGESSVIAHTIEDGRNVEMHQARITFVGGFLKQFEDAVVIESEVRARQKIR